MSDSNEPKNSRDHRVLIVDDDETTAALLAATLGTAFECLPVGSGETALALLADFRPEVVLLDIGMPGMDGYETCRRLRAELAEAQQPAVIFVSARESLDEHLRAYDCGGDDFVVKPVAPKEMLRKVGAMVGLVAERRQLQANVDSVRQMAMGFLTNLGETGTALQFMRNSQSCAQPADLARLAIDSLREYGLEAHVQLRPPGECLTYIASGSASPLDESVFAMVRDLDHVFQFRQRLIVNYPHVSVLVRNMPIEDTDRCGRLRDLLAIISEGCEASLQAILRAAEIERRTRQLQLTAETVRATLASLRKQYREQQTDTRVILYQMQERFTNDLFVLGLTEQQEEQMQELLDATIEETLGLFNRGLDFGDQLERLLQDIASTLSGSPTN